MKLKTILFGSTISLVLMGCAHNTMRGSVAMKISDDTAHVCINENEVQAGDRVRLYRNRCTVKSAPEKGIGPSTCEKVMLGEGTVIKNLNSHYSEVQFDKGVKFSEGMFVEKE